VRSAWCLVGAYVVRSVGMRRSQPSADAETGTPPRRRRARHLVSAGKEHVKHALQARYSRSNPASTHRAVAAAAARCLLGGEKRRSSASPLTTADLPGAPPPPPHPVLTTVLLGRVQPQSTHSSELCFQALLTRDGGPSPHARTSLELSAPLTCASNHVRPIVVVTLSCPYIPRFPRFGNSGGYSPSLSLLALV
jgi:hypothetical protein